MTYEVLKDYDEIEKYPDADGKTFREEVTLSLRAGETFVPAAINYPEHKVHARVIDGTLKLITRIPPTGTVSESA